MSSSSERLSREELDTYWDTDQEDCREAIDLMYGKETWTSGSILNVLEGWQHFVLGYGNPMVEDGEVNGNLGMQLEGVGDPTLKKVICITGQVFWLKVSYERPEG